MNASIILMKGQRHQRIMDTQAIEKEADILIRQLVALVNEPWFCVSEDNNMILGEESKPVVPERSIQSCAVKDEYLRYLKSYGYDIESSIAIDHVPTRIVRAEITRKRRTICSHRPRRGCDAFYAKFSRRRNCRRIVTRRRKAMDHTKMFYFSGALE